MGYELEHSSNKMSIRNPPYKRYVRVERTLGKEYSRESILFRIKHTPSFKVPFPEVNTLIGRYSRKNKAAISHKQKIKGLQALYLYYCYLLKIFPKQDYPPKYSKAMKEEINKMDKFSNSAKFLGKYKITTLSEVREYRTNATTEINELKSKRENLWKKHKRIKTDEEGQVAERVNIKLENKEDKIYTATDLKTMYLVPGQRLK